MAIKLPNSAYVNKFIAKSKFYEKANLGTKLQNEFVNKIQRITWKYKLSEETIGILKTENVTEIQIFELELKEQKIPKNVLKIIDRTIPYQILYIFTYQENIAYGITLKSNNLVENYYFSEWNEDIAFEFTGINLEKVYQKLIKAFLPEEIQKKKDFTEAITIDARIKELEKEIISLENRIKREKQFNRKVDTNKLLLEKKKELKSLKRKL
ncbi:MAG: DUF4391 domain-containing protein [Melioribacteraceae bacterium]|nr:DUF4391 domain-containing protein [Melioribacteraceae bacterium]